MTKRMFTEAELAELESFDEALEIDSRPWRHGRIVRRVWEANDHHWAAWFHEHHEEGDQSTYPIEAVAVHQVEKLVKVWEPAP